MESWSFLTSHARVLLCIAHDPDVRLRDIAASLDITERSAYGIVTDLTAAGYAVKQKNGRRNRYQIQAHLPLPETTTQQPKEQARVSLHQLRLHVPPNAARKPLMPLPLIDGACDLACEPTLDARLAARHGP